MKKLAKIPPTYVVVWTLVLGMVGAAIYQADVFGVRTKLLNKVFTPSA